MRSIRLTDCFGEPRGFTLMEVTVAAMAMAIVTVGILQATLALERAHQASQRVDYASRELDNMMERFIHQPWEAITPAAAKELAPAAELIERLPAAQLETAVFQESEPFDAKRVTMQLRWHAQRGRSGKPLVLTAWVLRQREPTP